MGCCSSLPNLDLITNRTLQELGLTRAETKKLARLFGKVDADGNGVIQVDEFFDFFEMQPSLVNKLIFSCYDLEQNGEMTFLQFVCTLWSFFTMTQERFGTFVFFIFDLQKTGVMSVAEVPSVVKQVHRKYYAESTALQGAVDKLLRGPGGASRVLSAEDFATWTFANPDVCRPVLGKQTDMIAKALGEGFWKAIRQRRSKVERLNKVDHIYRFMKQIRGNRDVFKKKLSPAERAEQERVAAIAAENERNAKFKAEKAAAIKISNSKTMHETSEGHQVSYFNVEDIDQLMDGYASKSEAGKEPGNNQSSKKKNKKSKSGKRSKGGDGGSANMLKTKELPPLVVKALQKGTLSSAAIAPMDNCRISDAARDKVRKERENELTDDEKKRIHARKAAKFNRAMSNEYNLFS